MGFFTEAIRLPSVKFPTIGTSYTGLVRELGVSEVPEFNDRGRIDGVKTDENGEAVTQVDVALEVEGSLMVLHTGGAIFYAIGRALAEIGADDLDVGDTLTVAYVGDGEPTAKGRNAPKQYEASIFKGLTEGDAPKPVKTKAA